MKKFKIGLFVGLTLFSFIKGQKPVASEKQAEPPMASEHNVNPNVNSNVNPSLDEQQIEEERERSEEATKLKNTFVPQPLVEVKKPEIKKVISKGLDTTDVGNQGNWLLKRVWYEQAEDTFGKILESLDSIIQQQIKLFKSITEAEKNSEDIFSKANLKIAELAETVKILLIQFDKKDILEEATLVRETRELVLENKANLEKLQEEIIRYQDLEETSTSVVNQIISQVNKAREYQKNGWANFKEIGETLNDDKAKDLYYKMEGYAQTLEKINSYLSGSLLNFLNNLSSKSMQAAKDIIASLDTLKNKELEIIKAANIFENAKEYLEEELAQEAKKAAAAKKAKQKKAESSGWFSSIINWFQSWF